MAEATHKLNVKVVAWTLGIFGLVNVLVAYVWHGLLKQPSIMNILYPGWSFTAPLNIATLAAVFLVGGLAYGALFALIYNWVAKRMK